MTELGYGIDYSKIEWADNADERIYDLLQFKTQYEEYCKDNDINPLEASSFAEFISDYENGTYLWSGRTGLLCDIINELEFEGDVVFRDEDYCIYVAAYIPKDEADKKKRPTQEQIAKIMEKYLDPLIKGSLDIQWYEIRD